MIAEDFQAACGVPAAVFNTALQLILPCLGDVKVLASIGAERISLTPDAPTVAEIAPDLNVTLWNGLFVHKDTPQDGPMKIRTCTTIKCDRLYGTKCNRGAVGEGKSGDAHKKSLRALEKLVNLKTSWIKQW